METFNEVISGDQLGTRGFLRHMVPALQNDAPDIGTAQVTTRSQNTCN